MVTTPIMRNTDEILAALKSEQCSFAAPKVMDRAADEIARLRQELAEVKAEAVKVMQPFVDRLNEWENDPDTARRPIRISIKYLDAARDFLARHAQNKDAEP